jgi:hypothetical protein
MHLSSRCYPLALTPLLVSEVAMACLDASTAILDAVAAASACLSISSNRASDGNRMSGLMSFLQRRRAGLLSSGLNASSSGL